MIVVEHCVISLLNDSCVFFSFARLLLLLDFGFGLERQKIFTESIILLIDLVVTRRILVFGQSLLSLSRLS